ncbi:MAG TPA: cyclic pyranopterin monophosphate synthase MoaC [Nitrospinota bacterium]|nr:cyclic pyranopterin monophosphate synthase MoaC [Nitrospinota bacterium]
MKKFTHFDEEGRSKMVDVSEKKVTKREAVAKGRVKMQAETLKMIMEGRIKKGDVLDVARVAGIMGAKKTSDFIPMCHPLEITGIDIDFKPSIENCDIEIESRVKVIGRTGVEMEALTSVSVAALTIYDMCKAVDKNMVISDIRLEEKRGGKSGEYIRRKS